MTFSVNLKWLSFKQNLEDKERMLADQVSTYAILRYAHDIPTRVLENTMKWLISMYFDDALSDRKLMTLVNEYRKACSINMVMDEEFVETLEIPITYDSNMRDDDIEEDDGEEIIILTL